MVFSFLPHLLKCVLRARPGTLKVQLEPFLWTAPIAGTRHINSCRQSPRQTVCIAGQISFEVPRGFRFLPSDSFTGLACIRPLRDFDIDIASAVSLIRL